MGIFINDSHSFHYEGYHGFGVCASLNGFGVCAYLKVWMKGLGHGGSRFEGKLEGSESTHQDRLFRLVG